jgi:hypothetical protein
LEFKTEFSNLFTICDLESLLVERTHRGLEHNLESREC